jgi:hypothetical protein
LNSDGITFDNNVIAHCRRYGMYAEKTTKLTITNNLIAGITDQVEILAPFIQAGIDVRQVPLDSLIVRDNHVVGVVFFAFIYQGYDCKSDAAKTEAKSRMSGNRAGSSAMGIAVEHNAKCQGLYDFTAIQCSQGLGSFFTQDKYYMENMKFIECGIGFHAN